MLIAFASLIIYPCSAHAVSLQKGLVIEQKHKMLGRLKISVIQDKLRVDLKDDGITYIVKDKSEVLAFNDEKKLIYRSQLKNWRPKLTAVFLMFTGNNTNISWTPVAKTKFKKYQSTIYLGSRYSSKLIAATGIKCPDYTSKFVLTIAGLAGISGVPDSAIPLQLTMIDSEQGVQNVIMTTNLQSVSLDPKMFLVPLGYKSVKDDRDLRSFSIEDF